MEKTFPLKIGLEIHGYLDTKEKLFCMCKTDFLNSEANSVVCPICTGQPGSKPMLPNKVAMDKVIEIALVLGCKINHDKNLVFQRKHYDWADNPKGYQTTISGAYSLPCAENGKFDGIRITECHLEEDPAQWNPETGGINYNRSGLPLVEIVTEPDFRTAEQVVSWLKNLVHSLSYIHALRKNGGIKCDVNISTYGDRVEIKNLNSLEKISKAIEYEIARQLENHEKGIVQARETLAFDEAKGKTIKMREKESGADYRFIPDPDLPPMKLDEKQINAVKKTLPEMPSEKLDKLIKKYKVDKANADILIKNLELVDFAEELGKSTDVAKSISWITIELLRVLNYNKKSLDDEGVEIKPAHLAELISFVDKGEITVLKAKQIMNEFVPKSFSVKEKMAGSIGKLSEEDTKKFVEQAISENKKVFEEYKSGKKESLNFLIGCVMKLSNRRADFAKVREIFEGR
ncbi:Aspartyl/glutamyl-tRNA(Asn/Gln) amidotransferase subunit B [uncultured archaeon]|nr:Aspartyl/glutamyl-tRNA(Asn/Gln) amidotransferase subunit B [uncultured archaeon]